MLAGGQCQDHLTRHEAPGQAHGDGAILQLEFQRRLGFHLEAAVALAEAELAQAAPELNQRLVGLEGRGGKAPAFLAHRRAPQASQRLRRL